MQLKILNQFNIVKQGDTKSEFKFQLLDFAEQPIDLSSKTVKVIIANNIGKVLEKSPTVLDATTGTISFTFGKNDVTGSGDMRLEIHVTDSVGDTQIIPSNGYYKFAIERNLNDASTGVTNYTLKYFTDQFEFKMNTFDNKMGEIDGAIQTANQSAQTANTAATNADNKATQLEQRVDQAIAASTIDLEVKDARGTHTNLKQRLDTTDALLAQTVKFKNTVAEMMEATYSVGDTVNTLGYYSVNDGGANLYKVLSITETKKNYDLSNGTVLFRPIAKNVINPIMFGVKADGVNPDNIELQSCFDYAYENKIPMIDGLGLTYISGTIDPYYIDTNIQNSYGFRINSGVKLSNFNFRTANGSTKFTNALNVIMNSNPIEFENSTFDGNKANVVNETGAWDGGLHGVFIYTKEGGVFPQEFMPCGNITFKNCKIIKPLSYGVAVTPLDCKIEYIDCEFDVEGIAAQAHSTTFIVNRAKVSAGTPRTGLPGDAFHEEIEFLGNYIGTKKQTIKIKNVEFDSLGNTGRSLFKVHYNPMRNVQFKEITVENCEIKDGIAVQLYNGTDSVLTVDELNITNPKTTNAYSVVSLLSDITEKINVKHLKITNKKDSGFIRISKAKVDKMELLNPTFIASGRMYLTSAIIDELLMQRGKNGTLDASGILRDTTSTINLLKLNDCEFTDAGQAILFEAIFSKVEVNNMVINPNANVHNTVFSFRGLSVTCSMSNVLLKGTSYAASNYFINAPNINSGVIYLNNVRHLTTVTAPAISAPSLAAGRQVLLNCSNLY